jgi:hypothetical protein
MANVMIQFDGKAWLATADIRKECLAYSIINIGGHPFPKCTSFASNWSIPGTVEGSAWEIFASGGVGPQGPAGLQGTKGDKDDQGIQGVQGPKAFKGYKEYRGLQAMLPLLGVR